ncbi:FliM/FliN family flagellar motor switch protein [Acerihabitans sp. TG2]|uniref:FliM/FliN family flagellar motor switch protein n=1 Tax=Acerihabitans sp. TG2 TaxID=3096008 RepID=UPI002B228197|nr:FliM/FliN family flagellar motor switch protein [Acerihabitans sp. TG2]MEA9389628.1 FliM/FliN family flagellar motor switch protein [Acerihabitans sp. TG2]
MRNLQLRPLSRADMMWRQVLADWQARQIPAGLATPPIGQPLFSITADNGIWRGMIDARDWLAHQLPELGALASTGRDLAHIAALFNAMDNPLTFEHDALAYQRLQAQVMPEQVNPSVTSLPCLAASECVVWLTEITNTGRQAPLPPVPVLGRAPVLLELIIGVSHASDSVIAKLAVGDIMLINQVTRQTTCQGRVIGHYWQQEEMIMMEEHYEECDMSEEYDLEDTPCEKITGSLSAVPMKLEFILQRRYLSIHEVQEIFTGKVFEMDPASEKQIEIRANGTLIARGELVQLDDRLGVEVMDIIQEHSDA